MTDVLVKQCKKIFNDSFNTENVETTKTLKEQLRTYIGDNLGKPRPSKENKEELSNFSKEVTRQVKELKSLYTNAKKNVRTATTKLNKLTKEKQTLEAKHAKLDESIAKLTTEGKKTEAVAERKLKNALRNPTTFKAELEAASRELDAAKLALEDSKFETLRQIDVLSSNKRPGKDENFRIMSIWVELLSGDIMEKVLNLDSVYTETENKLLVHINSNTVKDVVEDGESLYSSVLNNAGVLTMDDSVDRTNSELSNYFGNKLATMINSNDRVKKNVGTDKIPELNYSEGSPYITKIVLYLFEYIFKMLEFRNKTSKTQTNKISPEHLTEVICLMMEFNNVKSNQFLGYVNNPEHMKVAPAKKKNTKSDE